MPDVHVVLLSGGSGTRLWPLSNAARSKQFLKVLRDPEGRPESMVQRTFRMVGRAPLECDLTVATCAAQLAELRAQLPGDVAVAVEPERRDTAPAIMLACAHLASEQGAAPGDAVVAMPIDAFAGPGFYERLADLAFAVRKGAAELVLMGTGPTCPSSKYGYIVPGAAAAPGPALPVARFVEKPGAEEAARLVEAGALWNCGVFAFRLGWLLGVASRYAPDVSYGALSAGYGGLPRNSFDYEVVERAGSVAVVPYAGTWKDLGTWNALTEEMAEQASGRAVVDAATCGGTHVVNETGLPLVVSGVRDSVVVATPDGILVCGKPESAGIKPLVERAQEGRPMYEQRRWGEYRVLDSSAYPDGGCSLTKELVVAPGSQLSYQRHAHRREVWTVVSGEGEVALGGGVRPVGPGSVVDIAAGEMHAVRATTELRIVEVQLGSPLVEEDIERFGNFWGEGE